MKLPKLGIKEEKMGQLTPWVKPSPTCFPTNFLWTTGKDTPLHSIRSDWWPNETITWLIVKIHPNMKKMKPSGVLWVTYAKPSNSSPCANGKIGDLSAFACFSTSHCATSINLQIRKLKLQQNCQILFHAFVPHQKQTSLVKTNTPARTPITIAIEVYQVLCAH